MKKKGRLIAFLVWIWVLIPWVSLGVEHILQLHLKYRDPGAFSLPENAQLSSKDFSDDLWFVFSQAENYLQTNIPLLLEQEPRAEKLATYLRDGNALLQALKYHQGRVIAELQEFESTFARCESDLENANQLFSTSFSSYNEHGFLQAIAQAKLARACMWENMVLISANRSLRDRGTQLIAEITPRVAYLQEHQQTIISHYDILKTTLLAELHRIAVQLGQE